jgi:hypothetical protein
MDISAALRHEEAKWDKQTEEARQSAAARARISKATKERWAKFRAAKGKVKGK